MAATKMHTLMVSKRFRDLVVTASCGRRVSGMNIVSKFRLFEIPSKERCAGCARKV